jgi:hypothetical protein
MDAKDIRNLQEAYMEVVEGREGGRFEYNQRHGRPLITPEVSQRASETETLGGGTYQRGSKRLPKNKRKYDRQVLSGVRAASEQEKQRARKRLNVGENYDLYDIILSHLLDEGYAETPEAAKAIMVNMSEEWREDIVEISQKTATKAYATSYTGEFEGQDSPKNVKQTDNLRRQIKRKFGDKAAQHADRAGHAMTFGRKGAGGMPPKP